MTAQPAVRLEHGGVSATVLPDEGGVLLDLLVHGRPVLTATPWGSAVLPGARPAADESTWVERWRGGWQLCFPTAGQPNPLAAVAEGFHGTASQAPWLEVSRAPDTVALGWADREGLSAERLWRLTDHGAAVATRVHNAGDSTRVLVAAEHLILGGDVLAAPLALDVPAGTQLRPLDYAGLPEGAPLPWPGDPAERWTVVDRATPARVTGLAGVQPQRIGARGPHVDVLVEWQGGALPHALLWEELGASPEQPWNGQVVALGIEPTSTPHGAGTALDLDLVRLPPGGTLDWSVALSVRWASTTLDESEAS
ncbi:aldose epimerase family protein [Microcella humidisoli]|uniref:Galactose mutarotase n=1 Tax=Microcella humidisoli TaxID=2963406 RepID=A0ABY5FZ20_9MICO|nr:hypothetical protein [Microcella humidisoli]UTT63364.1 hypothetical protein NNL39_04470 [Microcella humidisoli]